MAESFHDRMRHTSHLAGTNVAYVEDLYEAFLLDPNSVSEEWRDYFDKLPVVEGALSADISHRTVVDQFEQTRQIAVLENVYRNLINASGN